MRNELNNDRKTSGWKESKIALLISELLRLDEYSTITNLNLFMPTSCRNFLPNDAHPWKIFRAVSSFRIYSITRLITNYLLKIITDWR